MEKKKKMTYKEGKVREEKPTKGGMVKLSDKQRKKLMKDNKKRY